MQDSNAEVGRLRAENDRLAQELEESRYVLAEVLEQQAATGRILAMISRAPTEVRPVFDTIAAAALELCEATSANVFTFDGTLLHAVALEIPDPEGRAAISRIFPQPPSRGLVACRAVLEERIVAIPDVLDDREYAYKEAAVAAGFRSVLGLPLLTDGHPVGAIAVGRPQPGPFPHRLLALLQTFADQAAIAIENARTVLALRREIEAHRRARATIRELVDGDNEARAVIGEAPAWRAVSQRIAQVAPTHATVLLLGETGTGKNLRRT